jgi:hypothetical protein
MSRASKHIYDFLDGHLGVYNNRNEVEFVVNNDDSVIVNHWIKEPPLGVLECGLCYTSDNFHDFLHDFKFAGTRALKAFTPDDLWAMYYNGQAEFYCIISSKVIYFSLYFRLEGNKTIIHDDHDNEYIPNKNLQTPQDFIDYTMKQFMHFKDEGPIDLLP